MKTITIDFETYTKEQEEIKKAAFNEGESHGIDIELDFISEVLKDPSIVYGENWQLEMAGKLTPEIESAILKLHKVKKPKG